MTHESRWIKYQSDLRKIKAEGHAERLASTLRQEERERDLRAAYDRQETRIAWAQLHEREAMEKAA